MAVLALGFPGVEPAALRPAHARPLHARQHDVHRDAGGRAAREVCGHDLRVEARPRIGEERGPLDADVPGRGVDPEGGAAGDRLAGDVGHVGFQRVEMRTTGAKVGREVEDQPPLAVERLFFRLEGRRHGPLLAFFVDEDPFLIR